MDLAPFLINCIEHRLMNIKVHQFFALFCDGEYSRFQPFWWLACLMGHDVLELKQAFEQRNFLKYEAVTVNCNRYGVSCVTNSALMVFIYKKLIGGLIYPIILVITALLHLCLFLAESQAVYLLEGFAC